MENAVDVLVVSSRIENKRTLLRTLEGLPVNTFSASTIFQALEFLATHPLAIVFCEERLSDGLSRTTCVGAQFTANESIHCRAMYG